MTDTAPSDRGETLISMEELALAARNHGMPLEALRYDITPLGLHYLLIHFDIPDADETTWRLEVGGQVRRVSLTMEELRRRPQVTAPVTLECAGNGRARIVPRPVSQPWLEEAVGTAEWTGTPLPLLEEAGVGPGAVEVVFTGADRGVQAGLEHDYEAQPDPGRGHARGGAAGLGGQRPASCRWRLPAAAGRARLVRHDLGQVAAPDHRGRRAVRRLPADRHLQAPHLRGGPGHPGDPGSSRGRCCSPGHPRVRVPPAAPAARPPPALRPAWSGLAPVDRVEVSTDGGATWAPARLDRSRPWAWAGWTFEWDAPRQLRAVLPGHRRRRQHPATDTPWNTGGYANNAVQRVEVTVQERAGAEAQGT